MSAPQRRATLGGMLLKALAIERSAVLQYQTHSLRLSGVESTPAIERIQEITGDEIDHVDRFEVLAVDFLDMDLVGDVPTQFDFRPSPASDVQTIIRDNLKREIEGIDFYKKIIQFTNESATTLELPFQAEVLHHEILHIILDEQEHVVELRNFLV